MENDGVRVTKGLQEKADRQEQGAKQECRETTSGMI